MAVVQFNLRVPEELKKQVGEAAQISGRSINAEAAYRLEQSFVEEVSNIDDDGTIRLSFDKAWLEGTGLSKAEFGSYVREVITRQPYQIDKK